MQTGNVFPAYIPGSYSKSKYMCKGGGDMKKRGKRIAAVFLAAAMTMLPVERFMGKKFRTVPSLRRMIRRQEESREGSGI